MSRLKIPWSLEVAAALLIFSAAALLPPAVSAQDQPPASGERSTGGAGGEMSATVGIGGHYRIGYWTAVRWAGAGDAGRISIETLDGDGTRVVYRQPAAGVAENRRGGQGYAIAGSEAAPLVIRDGSEVIVSTRFPERRTPAQGPAMIPLGMPWIVAIGDPLGIDQIGVNELLGRPASVAVSQPRRPATLPATALGYDGVDLIVINSNGREVLAALSERQAEAIVDWVHGGGHLLITLGESAPALLDAAPWLDRLLPIDRDDVVTTAMNPSGLEAFMSSQTRLEPFTGMELPREGGRVLVTGRTMRRVSAALAARYHAGLGQVTAIAADLQDPPLAEWPQRLKLVRRLTGTILDPAEDQRLAARRATGFNDLAGQMRATLDRFEVKRSVPFSILALAVLVWIAVIGPLDYWLLNRVFGRPLLGWWTFPLAAVGFSALLILAARPAAPAGVEPGGRPPELRYNRIEIIDLDAVEKVGRGFAWNHIYSHPARRVTVQAAGGELFGRLSRGVDSMLTAPLGFAGAAFGGIQIAGEDARMPEYEVVMRDDGALRSMIDGLPLAPRSSKSLATHYRFEPRLADKGEILRRPGSELLQGELRNPLPVDLLDGMLIYRNWVYLLPTRFPAGGRIDSIDALRQKNFRWQLTRQKALESATESEAWDASRYDAPGRVAEMLMFHAAAGGTRYTGLRHQPLSSLDLSDLLSEDRCILLGRLAEPVTEVRLSVSGQSGGTSEAGAGEPGDRDAAAETLSLIRVVLPVRTAGAR